MFQNSLNKLKNTGKWQFELHLFLNKCWGCTILNIVCKMNACHRLTVIISYSKVDALISSRTGNTRWTVLNGECKLRF